LNYQGVWNYAFQPENACQSNGGFRSNEKAEGLPETAFWHLARRPFFQRDKRTKKRKTSAFKAPAPSPKKGLFFPKKKSAPHIGCPLTSKIRG